MKRVAVVGVPEAVKLLEALRAPIEIAPRHDDRCAAVLGEIALPDLYVKVVPARLFDARLCPLRDKREVDVDFVVYGELGTGDGERVCQAAFAGARRPGRRRRVLLGGESLREPFRAVAREHSDVVVSELSVVDAVEQMVRAPEKLDIIVVERAYAGVLGSLGVALAGGPGLAASARLGPCPVFTGQGVGAFLAAAMMLEELGFRNEAARVETAVRRAVGEDRTTPELGGAFSLDEVGAFVRRNL